MNKWIKALIFIVLIVIGVFLYARFIGTMGLKIKEYKITSETLPEDFHGLKIVQLSDVHYNKTTKKKQLTNIVEKINSLNPDIVVITGDLFDKDTTYSTEDFEDVAEVINKITATTGKYIISGNHDKIAKIYDNFVANLSFTNLDDKFELVYSKSNQSIIVSGISSTIHDNLSIAEKEKALSEYLATLKEGQTPFKLLLMHEPDYASDVQNNYDVILSGHSHGGQIRLPFIGKLYTPIGSQKYYNEYYKINNSELFISSGVGTSWLNIRLFNRPSINFYRVTKKTA